eukprot:g3489.t2
MASGTAEAKYAPDGPEAQRIARTIPYYPFKGIDRFYDIGGMCADPEAFALAVKIFADRGKKIDSIGGFDARGFILGPPVALALNIPFFMLRKKGKMPNVIDGAAYSKEYKGDDSGGLDALCVQRSAATSGQRVVLVDDLVATGGTLLAGVDLVKSLGAEVVECACMIELKALNGVGKLHERHPDVPVWSLISEDILTALPLWVMGCASVVLKFSGALLLAISTAAQNDTCSTETCGVSTCDPGSELEVSLDGTSLEISCNPCLENFFKADESPDPCTACPDGLVSEVGATACTLEPGFWRTSDTSDVVYECPNADACIGGATVATACSDGFKGPLCAVCENDFYPSGSFECLECSDGNAASAIITIIIFLAALAVFLVVLSKASTHVEEKAREHGDPDDRANDAAVSKVFKFVKQWKDTLVVRFKVIVAHFQIVTTFPNVLDVQWPEAFNRYADKVSVISLDFWGLLSQSCWFTPDFLKQLVFTTLLPLGIVLILVARYAKIVKSGPTPEKRRAAFDVAAGGVLLTGFFFYIVTSTLILEAFDCQDFDDGSSYLKADFRISCDSDKYTFIYGYAIVMAILFPAGIPLTYLAVLYMGKERINPEPEDPEVSLKKREEDATIQKTKFLWGTYRPAVYYYEVWECVRKLFLTGLLVYFKEGTSTQVVIAMLITLAGLRVLAGLRPYQREDENNLAEASLWVTFLTLFAGLLIKSEVADEDGYDTVALGVILSIMNAALVALAVFQILWATSQFFKEKFGGAVGVDVKRKNRPKSTQGPASSNKHNQQQYQQFLREQQQQEEQRAPHSTSPDHYRPRGRAAVRPDMNKSPRHRSPVPMDLPVRGNGKPIRTSGGGNANNYRSSSRA